MNRIDESSRLSLRATGRGEPARELLEATRRLRGDGPEDTANWQRAGHCAVTMIALFLFHLTGPLKLLAQPGTPLVNPAFPIIGVGPGQIFRFHAAGVPGTDTLSGGGPAGANCQGVLSLQDTPNAPVGSSLPVNLQPFSSTYLEFDPVVLNREARQRIYFQPVLTLSPNSGPCAMTLEILNKSRGEGPGQGDPALAPRLAVSVTKQYRKVLFQGPYVLLDADMSAIISANPSLIPFGPIAQKSHSVILGFGQTLEFVVKHNDLDLPQQNKLCSGVLELWRTDNPTILLHLTLMGPPPPLPVFGPFFLSSGQLGVAFGQTVPLELVVKGPGFEACTFGFSIIDSITLGTMESLPF